MFRLKEKVAKTKGKRVYAIADEDVGCFDNGGFDEALSGKGKGKSSAVVEELTATTATSTPVRGDSQPALSPVQPTTTVSVENISDGKKLKLLIKRRPSATSSSPPQEAMDHNADVANLTKTVDREGADVMETDEDLGAAEDAMDVDQNNALPVISEEDTNDTQAKQVYSPSSATVVQLTSAEKVFTSIQVISTSLLLILCAHAIICVLVRRRRRQQGSWIDTKTRTVFPHA